MRLAFHCHPLVSVKLLIVFCLSSSRVKWRSLSWPSGRTSRRTWSGSTTTSPTYGSSWLVAMHLWRRYTQTHTDRRTSTAALLQHSSVPLLGSSRVSGIISLVIKIPHPCHKQTAVSRPWNVFLLFVHVQWKAVAWSLKATANLSHIICHLSSVGSERGQNGFSLMYSSDGQLSI